MLDILEQIIFFIYENSVGVINRVGRLVGTWVIIWVFG